MTSVNFPDKFFIAVKLAKIDPNTLKVGFGSVFRKLIYFFAGM